MNGEKTGQPNNTRMIDRTHTTSTRYLADHDPAHAAARALRASLIGHDAGRRPPA